MKIKISLLLYTASAVLTFSMESVGLYSVKDLGVFTDLPRTELSKPYTINNQSQVSAANLLSGAYRAVLYGGAWTNLGTLGGDKSVASSVNDAGRVVGYSLTAQGMNRAFLWTPGGKNGIASNLQMKDLGTLGGTNSEAYDINGTGQITGYAQTADSSEHAFLYNGSVMTDIGKLLDKSLPYSFGYAINGAGHVAGTAYNKNYSTPRAFFYNGTTAIDIGALGGKGASALALNNNDQIAGYYMRSDGFDHAFRYAGGAMSDLGTLGGNWSYAFAINNNNVIVGGSFINSDDSVYHSFVSVNNTLVDLNTRLDASGKGWTLVEAYGINDAGQIVGIGQYSGTRRAFLLNPVTTAIAAPRITNIKRSGANVLISFSTSETVRYALEANPSLVNGSWTVLNPSITGNGSVMTVTNAGIASVPQRFFRIKQVGP